MTDEPRKPQPGDDDYVGYGHPPKKNQFQKGTSGNAGGKSKAATPPKKGESIALILARVLNEKHTVEMGGRRKRMSQLEVNIRSLARRALTSDRAMKLLNDLIAQAGLGEPEPKFEGGVLVVGPYLNQEQWEAKYGGPQTLPPFPILDRLRAELFKDDPADDPDKI